MRLLERLLVGTVGEQALAGAEDDRVQHEPVQIDQVSLLQRIEELSAP